MKHSIIEILNYFRAEKPKKTVFGNYRIEDDELIYRSQVSESIYRPRSGELTAWKKQTGAKLRETDGRLVDETGKLILLESISENTRFDSKLKIEFFETNKIAKKIKLDDGRFLYFGNLETLDLIGRTVAYGNESRNSEETEIQKHMKRAGFIMRDLKDVDAADFSTFELVDYKERNGTATESYFDRQSYKQLERSVSVLIATALYKLDGKHFLTDVDDRDLKAGKLNYFTVRVNKCETIDDAYHSMRPTDVLKAEESGVDIKRIGNLYAIPCDAPTLPELSLDEKFKILAESSSYSLKESDIKYICGENYSKSRKDADDLLEKVPRERSIDVNGETYKLSTAITIDGTLYALGTVDCTNRSQLRLKQWHIIKSLCSKRLKTESEGI